MDPNARCPLCDMPLGLFPPRQAHMHVDECTGTRPSSGPHEHAGILQVPTCAVCGRDMSLLTLSARELHSNLCLDRVAGEGKRPTQERPCGEGSRRERATRVVQSQLDPRLQRLLELVGLTRYAKRFAQHELDLEMLRGLSEEEWAELGLPDSAQRRIKDALVCAPLLRQTPEGTRGEKERCRGSGKDSAVEELDVQQDDVNRPHVAADEEDGERHNEPQVFTQQFGKSNLSRLMRRKRVPLFPDEDEEDGENDSSSGSDAGGKDISPGRSKLQSKCSAWSHHAFDRKHSGSTDSDTLDSAGQYPIPLSTRIPLDSDKPEAPPRRGYTQLEHLLDEAAEKGLLSTTSPAKMKKPVSTEDGKTGVRRDSVMLVGMEPANDIQSPARQVASSRQANVSPVVIEISPDDRKSPARGHRRFARSSSASVDCGSSHSQSPIPPCELLRQDFPSTPRLSCSPQGPGISSQTIPTRQLATQAEQANRFSVVHSSSSHSIASQFGPEVSGEQKATLCCPFTSPGRIEEWYTDKAKSEQDRHSRTMARIALARSNALKAVNPKLQTDSESARVLGKRPSNFTGQPSGECIIPQISSPVLQEHLKQDKGPDSHGRDELLDLTQDDGKVCEVSSPAPQDGDPETNWREKSQKTPKKHNKKPRAQDSDLLSALRGCPHLTDKLLILEPVSVEAVEAVVKDAGFKIATTKLVDFLDRQGLSYKYQSVPLTEQQQQYMNGLNSQV